MKRNDIKSLHELPVEKLKEKQAEISREFAKARMEHRVGRLKNVTILSVLRDDLARVMTVMRNKKQEVK